MPTLNINGKNTTVDAEPDTPLLWVLRAELKLVGTKYGCGKALCGACTVHLDGKAIKSCTMFAVQADGREVLTIEGLAADGKLDPMQGSFWN